MVQKLTFTLGITPAEIEYLVTNNHACLRFNYVLPDGETLPDVADFYTALTPEQAREMVIFLQEYLQQMMFYGDKLGDCRIH